MKKKRIALLNSVLALLLCVAMLAGSTFAWFTDEVVSTGNIIQSGTLDVELEYWNGSDWKTVQGATKLFGEDLWEPGYTEVLYLKVSNQGNLALKWQLAINIISEDPGTNKAGESFKLSDHIYMGVVEGVQPEYASREAAVEAVKDNSGIIGKGFSGFGEMEAGAAEQYMAVVVYMPTTVDNVANHNGEDDATIDMGISLLATQKTAENDSFGSDYDAGAQFPTVKGDATGSATVETENGATTGDTTITTNTDVTAEVPAGVKVEDGTETLELTVSNGISRSDNISMVTGEVSRSFDVHISGVAEDNTVPMIINLGAILPAGMKTANVRLVHVENGTPVEMTLVDTLTAHNQYTYDSTTGEVTVALASFSELTAVLDATDPWDGTEDTSWYNTSATSFTIDTEEKLAGLGRLVAEGKTFEGKTIKLGANLDLGGVGHEHVFYPIGYRYSESDTDDTAHPFKGTFDGDGHTITDLYQNTWNIKGHYDNGYYKKSLGLFALIEGGTVKNLVINNFVTEGEFATNGGICGRANGGTFSNIAVYNCHLATYNTGVAGIVGWDVSENGATYNFTDILIDRSTTIAALWGTYDAGVGGIMGFLSESSKANLTNCTVAAVLDVNNDVNGNYQYYQYRYSGMLIGTVGRDGVPDSNVITCNNCKVYYRNNWINYHYCELVANSPASYTHDYQFSRLTQIAKLTEIQTANGWLKAGNFLIVAEDGTKTCYHIVKDENGNLVQHFHADAGKEIVDGVEVLVEDKQIVHLPFSQLYTGYGWGASPVTEHENVSVGYYDYVVTYIGDGNVLKMDYVENDKAYTVDAAGEGYEWLTSLSEKAPSSIPAGNMTDYTFYKDAVDVYTARFVDQFGNVIYEENFQEDATSLANVPTVPPVTDCQGKWEEYTLKNADITIKPVYVYKGNLRLTPVDSDGDGQIDSYQVDAASGLEGKVEIPGAVNGYPVKVVVDVSSEFINGITGGNITEIVMHEGVETISTNAFAMTSGLKKVSIPSTVTSIGANAFANTVGGALISKQITITYAGTWEQFQAACEKNWERGLATGTTVICTDGTATLKATEYLLYSKYEWTFVQK